MKELVAVCGEENLSVVFVALEKSRIDVDAFLAANSITWPTYWDGKGWQNDVAERFLVKLAPCYLLIDRQGILRARGGPTMDLKKRVEALLAER
ncbi:MAG: hypothetical protein H7343_23570 [Undibacterium sp.]|nr:hypothetical protein [Opitutaceae bacterium]